MLSENPEATGFPDPQSRVSKPREMRSAFTNEQLWNRRDQLVQTFEASWGRVGRELPRVKRAEDIAGIFGPLRQGYISDIISVYSVPSSQLPSAKRLRKLRCKLRKQTKPWLDAETAVKSEVAANKSELEKTIAELKRTNGDLGVQSGLIATNGKELAALKALGDRNYFEFNLTKTKEPRKVGDITMLLKKTDPKKNKYTIELVADDKRVEKKDKNLNEPVQFYVAKARQPYEIVVNEVKKDQIIGYLTTPKVQASRN